MRKVITTIPYSFTVTLLPKMYGDPAEIQFDKTYYELRCLLSRLCAFDLTIVAELTKNCCIHYHGIINFMYDPRVFAPKVFHDAFRKHRLFGFVNIKQITDMAGWVEYISKDLEQTRKAINRPPVIEDRLDNLKIPVISNLKQVFE